MNEDNAMWHKVQRSVAVLLGVVALIAPLLVHAEISWKEAEYQTFPDEQLFDGVVEAVHKATISAQTAGEIIALPYDINDYVPKDAIVVRFVDTQQKAALDRAVAAEAEAQARLEEVQASHKRNQDLIERNLVSQAQLEQSAADLKSARARLNSASAALKEAREQWEYTVVRAPYAGVLVERFVEIGERATVGTPLGTGLSLEKLRVEVAVPARYADQVRKYQQARVYTPTDEWLNAQSINLFPYADPNSHTFTTRVALPEGQHGLFPGMRVKTAFTLGERSALVIPTEAIVQRSEVSAVYVQAESGSIRLRQIRVGREIVDGVTEVLAGLEAGERVALDTVAAGILLKQQTRAQ